MKCYTYKSTPLGSKSAIAVLGGKFLYSALLRHALIPFNFVMIVSFLCLACSKETSVTQYPEMQAYYAESCYLGVAASDSVQRFSLKVETFVTRHTDAKQDPLYPRIQDNIRAASIRLNFNFDTEWEPEYEDTF